MAQAIALKGVEFQSSHTISFSSVRFVILYSFQLLTKQCLLTPPLYVAFTWLWVWWIPIALASSCYGYCPASSLIFFIIYNLPLGSNPILNQAYSCYDKSISFDACSAVHFAKTEPSASIDFLGLYDVEGYWQGMAHSYSTSSPDRSQTRRMDMCRPKPSVSSSYNYISADLS